MRHDYVISLGATRLGLLASLTRATESLFFFFFFCDRFMEGAKSRFYTTTNCSKLCFVNLMVVKVVLNARAHAHVT